MLITGHALLLGVLLRFDGVPVLGFSFFRFQDSPYIIVKALQCDDSQPSKNTIRSPRIADPCGRCLLF